MTDAGITPGEIRTREAESASRQGDWIASGVTPADPALPSVLDRVIPLVGATPWQTLGWVATLSVARGAAPPAPRRLGTRCGRGGAGL